MALSEEQLDFVEWAKQLGSIEGRPEVTANEIIAGCQFEGLGVPSEEDVEEALRELRDR